MGVRLIMKLSYGQLVRRNSELKAEIKKLTEERNRLDDQIMELNYKLDHEILQKEALR